MNSLKVEGGARAPVPHSWRRHCTKTNKNDEFIYNKVAFSKAWPPANACVLLPVVTSGHTAKMAVTPFDQPYSRISYAARTLHRSMCYRRGVVGDGIFILRASYTNFTRTPWRDTGCANTNFLRQGFRKLSVSVTVTTVIYDQLYSPSSVADNTNRQ